MKKILLSILTIALVGTVAFGVTRAQFTDTETVTGNTFTAGSIDLKVDGDDEPLTAKFSADQMSPGNVYNGGCVSLSNVGSLDGVLTVEVSNLVSNDNGEIEPETTDGDVAGTEIDPTGYDANTGDGELWDQITIKLCLDNGAGSHTGNGICDGDDTIIKGFSSTQDDYSSYYSIPLNIDLATSLSYVIAAGGSIDFCVDVKFIDDQTSSWWGGQGSLTNNMAMTDDAQFDITFGLEQTATP